MSNEEWKIRNMEMKNKEIFQYLPKTTPRLNPTKLSILFSIIAKVTLCNVLFHLKSEAWFIFYIMPLLSDYVIIIQK